MDMLLVFLSTAVGTIVGVVAAIVMMNRRRPAPAVNDTALRTQLQNTEWALASAGRDVEELRKQLAEREGVRDELERTQQQLVAIVADKEKVAAARAAADQRAAEIEAEAAALRERTGAVETASQRVVELEAALAAAKDGASQTAVQAAEESARRIAELETALAAAREGAEQSVVQAADEAARRITELQTALTAADGAVQLANQALDESSRRITELEASLLAAHDGAEQSATQAANEGARRIADLETALSEARDRVTSADHELAALRQGMEDAAAVARRVVELEAALGAAESEVLALRDRINAAGSGAQESAQRIASLENEVQALHAQAAGERERFERFAGDAAQLEAMLLRERRSVVEAMELLSAAQDKFAGSFAGAR